MRTRGRDEFSEPGGMKVLCRGDAGNTVYTGAGENGAFKSVAERKKDSVRRPDFMAEKLPMNRLERTRLPDVTISEKRVKREAEVGGGEGRKGRLATQAALRYRRGD